MIDIAIIGAGPAGLSAAINAYARNKSVIIFSNKINASALFKAHKINNHLGMFNKSGKDLLNIFLDHINNLSIKIKTSRVNQVLAQDNFFSISFNEFEQEVNYKTQNPEILNIDKNNFLEARTIIIATGVAKSKKIKGEEKFLGHGVSYCTTCDGMLFKNKSVIAIADSIDFESDIKFLSSICNKIIYIPKYDYQDAKKFNNNVQIMKYDIQEILGSNSVSSVLINNKKIECDGVFILNQNLAPQNLIFGLELNNNFIKINNLCETNLTGVFAAGDCTGWPWQLSKAIGQGQVAALSAAKFIDNIKSQSQN